MILVLDRPGGRCSGLLRALEGLGQNCVLDDGLDLRSMSEVRAAVSKVQPTVVVFGGATEPALGEDEVDTVFIDNAEAVIGVAAAALEFSAVPVLLSSSAVFSGRGPFDEGDDVTPGSLWAESRLKGEAFLTRANKDALVLRYGPLIEHEAESTVPGSGKVRPVAWPQVARVLVAALEQNTKGIIHCASSPAITRDALREQLGLPPVVVVTGVEHGYRELSTARLEVLLGGPLKSWQEYFSEAAASAAAPSPPKQETDAGLWADDECLQAGLLELKRGESQTVRAAAGHLLVVTGKVVLERPEHPDEILEQGSFLAMGETDGASLMALAPSKVVWVGSKA